MSAPTTSVYFGLGKLGRLRHLALKREASRSGRSISDIFWEALRKTATGELALELDEIDRLEADKSAKREARLE